jgi:monofunctional biosynthetic peptidoglycan transglycosylase
VLPSIAPALPRAVIAAEDGSFCTHHGSIGAACARPSTKPMTSSEMRGGSTVTRRSRKICSFGKAAATCAKRWNSAGGLIDLVLPKRRVMEIYLNIAEWVRMAGLGRKRGCYAFGKSARALSNREAAVLAAVLPSPGRRSARQPSAAVQRLAGIYEARATRFRARTACVGLARAP